MNRALLIVLVCMALIVTYETVGRRWEAPPSRRRAVHTRPHLSRDPTEGCGPFPPGVRPTLHC
jgi:hypothetical protein